MVSYVLSYPTIYASVIITLVYLSFRTILNYKCNPLGFTNRCAAWSPETLYLSLPNHITFPNETRPQLTFGAEMVKPSAAGSRYFSRRDGTRHYTSPTSESTRIPVMAIVKDGQSNSSTNQTKTKLKFEHQLPLQVPPDPLTHVHGPLPPTRRDHSGAAYVNQAP